MSTNRRKLKRNTRPPKRYEDSISATSKRNGNEQESNNDEISKEDDLNKNEKEVRGNLGENGQTLREFDENLEKINNVEEIKRNEEIENLEKLNNAGRDATPTKSVCDDNGVYTKSYTNMVKNNDMAINKNLIFIAPKITEDGMVKVLFNEEILRYHTRRMWGKFDLKDVIVNASGVNLFKFRNENGMKCVLEQGSWLIKSRPLFVQKWDPDIGMKKTEPSSLPIWIKMVNIPMEAWSMEGISALASSIGKAMIMDEMTASMCHNGVGRTDYARVLVEIDAKVELKETCTHCNVFSHCFGKCIKRPRTDEEKQAIKDAEQIAEKEKSVKQNKFVEVQNRKKNNQSMFKNGQQKIHNGYGNRQVYRKKNVVNEGVSNANKNGSQKSKSPVTKDASERNMFEVLNEMTEEETAELRVLKDRMMVDVYLTKKIQPTCAEAGNWSKDMIRYFKDGWEIDRLKEKEDQRENVENVFDNQDGMAQTMVGDNVIGMSKGIRN
ncbi:RNA-directed DNA polymerase, eukaryota, reverse transcriptase zinc-binding domain protein [Tanacetum coccineum]